LDVSGRDEFEVVELAQTCLDGGGEAIELAETEHGTALGENIDQAAILRAGAIPVRSA
jgi:hypothetical protein